MPSSSRRSKNSHGVAACTAITFEGDCNKCGWYGHREWDCERSIKGLQSPECQAALDELENKIKLLRQKHLVHEAHVATEDHRTATEGGRMTDGDNVTTENHYTAPGTRNDKSTGQQQDR